MQRLFWLLLRPACAEVNQAMQELTGVNYNTGEQNKDMTKAKQVCDWKDTLTILQYLQERNPFSIDPSLWNIATGVHAHSTINVDTALAVGDTILKSMDGKTPAEYTFMRKNQVVGDEGFLPLQTSLAPAPKHLLWVIRCNCKADCSTGTMRCTCKKHDIECTPACGNCRGSGCMNTLCDSDEDDENDDIYLASGTTV